MTRGQGHAPHARTGRFATALAAIALAISGLAGTPVASGAYAPAKNGKVFYTRSLNTGADIFSITGAGTGVLNVTDTATSTERGPSISPNGRSLAYTLYDGVTDFDIVLRTLPAGPVVDLPATSGLGQQRDPAFSPDGRSIAYAATVAGQTEIFLMNADGTGARNLSNTASDDEGLPAFSPDGTQITYTRFDGQNEIYAMNVDGSSQRNLTNTPAPVGDFDSEYSPDGGRIVFTRVQNSDCDVWSMAADGSGQVNLTKTPVNSECDPSYSADGKKVLYNRSDSGQLDLWTMRPDGSGQGNLTRSGVPVNEDGGVWESIFTCAGRRATIVGDAGPDRIKGTGKRDVIVANAGRDVVRGRGGNDLICLGAGRDRVVGGKGRDLCRGGKGKDKAKGCERGKP